MWQRVVRCALAVFAARYSIWAFCLGILRAGRGRCRRVLNRAKGCFTSTKHLSPEQMGFYSTFCALSATVLAILMTFLAGYAVYSRQRRDDLSVQIRRQLSALNDRLIEFSYIEKSESGAMPPSGHVLTLLEAESWVDRPGQLFDSDVNAIFRQFGELHQKYNGRIPVLMLWVKVESMLYNLTDRIYLEFPRPPAVVIEENGATHIEKLVRDDFPGCQDDFERWARKVVAYRECVNSARYKLYSILGLVRSTSEDAAKREKVREESEDADKGPALTYAEVFPNMSGDSRAGHYAAQAQYYDRFFAVFNSVVSRTEDIAGNIGYYRNYGITLRFCFGIVFAVVAGVFGIVVPLIELSARRLVWSTGAVQTLVAAGFFFFMTLCVSMLLYGFSNPVSP